MGIHCMNREEPLDTLGSKQTERIKEGGDGGDATFIFACWLLLAS